MSAGVAGSLFQCSYKFNANVKSTSLKLYFAGTDLLTAKTKAVAISAYMKAIMPVDCHIVGCVLSNNNTKKDGKLVKAAVGPGSYVLPGTTPPPSGVNRDMDAVLMRFESDDGIVPLKFAPIPDNVVAGNILAAAVADCDPMPTVAPASAGTGADWYANFTLLMKAIGFYSHHVKSGHAPGGAYTYYPWTAAFVTGVSGKKGARLIA